MEINLIGRTIKEIRRQTAAEQASEGWDDNRPATVIILDDGTRLFPSRDDEGNGPGALFGITADGDGFAV